MKLIGYGYTYPKIQWAVKAHGSTTAHLVFRQHNNTWFTTLCGQYDSEWKKPGAAQRCKVCTKSLTALTNT